MKKTNIALTVFLFFSLILIFNGCVSRTQNSTSAPSSVNSVTTVKSQIADKKWLLSGYNTGAIFVPLEPGNGSTAWVLFQSNGTLSGNTGINDFSGTWTMDKSSTDNYLAIRIKILQVTKKAAPNETAAKFESDLLAQFDSSRQCLPGKDKINFVDANKKDALQFIYRSGDSLF